MSNKVLITDDVHPNLIAELESAGCHVDYYPDIDRSAVLEIVSGYIGLVINSKIRADRELIDKAPDLKFIGRLGSGMEIIETAYASQRGIACMNSPEGNRLAVAEQALGMLLSVFNNLTKADALVRQRQWLREPNRGFEVSGKTIGLLGFGNTGSAFAGVLRGFDVELLAYDKYREGFGDDFVNEVTMADIFQRADIVSLHLPLTQETEHLVDRAFIEQFSKDIYLINTSRGKIVHNP